MNTPYVFKRCTGCGKWLVANKINFHKNKTGKYGIESKCKKCKAERMKRYHQENKDKIAEQKKKYCEENREKIAERRKKYRKKNKDKIAEWHKQNYEKNKDKILEQCKKYRKKNKDKIAKRNKQYYEENRDKVAEISKKYREKNKDKIAEQGKKYYEGNKEKITKRRKKYYEENRDKIIEQGKKYYKKNKDKIDEIHKQYYEENKDKVLERCKKYRKKNKDKIAEYHKQYYLTPQGQTSAFNSSNRRRLRKQSQGNGITKEQWLECMKFFGFRCAYSEKVLSQDTRTLDHIKALNKDGEHEIWNLIPMYRPYNSSKQDKDMLEWYQQQDFYSEERLQKIYEWQEYAFNKWGYETLEDNELE